MGSSGNRGSEAEDRKLSQGSVDGFWILLVFGLLFFNPFVFGSNGSRINLSLYDILLPLIFFSAVAQGQITWPERKTVLLFLSPCFLIVLHSVLTVSLAEGIHLGPLLVGTLRQAAFFVDIGMLILLFQMQERRRPSQGVFLALLFIATVYALMMRYLEAHVPDWLTYETIYAAIVTGLLLLFLFIQRLKGKSESFLKTGIFIAWVFAILLLLYTKLFILITLFIAVLFFFEESREFGGRRIKRLLFSAGFFSALGILFVAALIEMDLGRHFVTVYGALVSAIHQSIDIRFQLWSSAWGFVLETFPWGTGLNQFGDSIAETSSLQALRLANVHNTPLRLLMELGILGVGIFGVVLAMVAFSGRKLDAYQKAMLCLYILMPMLLHDALGLRIFHIVLAFCLAMTFFPTGTTLKERRSP